MITGSQQTYIEEHAYVPEHIPHYVTAVTQADPFLFGDFLTYVKKDHLIFVGYPLKENCDERQMAKVLDDAIKRFKPRDVAVTGPVIPSSISESVRPPSDSYYRLDLSTVSIPPKVRNMLSRAGRELAVKKSRCFDEEHERMVDDFLKVQPVEEATRFIFKRIMGYISSSNTAWVFDARNEREELVAFDVAEFKPRHYVLYMFNFSSGGFYVPGASDLLLSEVIKQGKTERKKYVNLGLGINPGVTFFKKKWGGVAFLPYASCLYHPSTKKNLETLLQKLL